MPKKLKNIKENPLIRILCGKRLAIKNEAEFCEITGSHSLFFRDLSSGLADLSYVAYRRVIKRQ